MQALKKAVANCLEEHSRKTLGLEHRVKQKLSCYKAVQLIGLCLIGAVSLCLGTPTRADSVTGIEGHSVSSALNFTIIIPAVLHLMENTHPSSLLIPDLYTPQIEAQQRIVVWTTLRRGFCMDLRLNQAQVTNWQLQVSGSKSTWVEAVDGGYRLCIRRAGRYELALQHEFRLRQGNSVEARSPPELLAIAWPVDVSMVTP